MTQQEDKEFEDQSKIMRTLWLKKNLRDQGGIDTTKISQHDLDEVRRAQAKNEEIQKKYQSKFQELNIPYSQASTKLNQDIQKLNDELTKLNTDYQAAHTELNKNMQAEIAEARAGADKIILQIKKDQGLVQEPKIEPAGAVSAELKQEVTPEKGTGAPVAEPVATEQKKEIIA
jgi:hypothetical protein